MTNGILAKNQTSYTIAISTMKTRFSTFLLSLLLLSSLLSSCTSNPSSNSDDQIATAILQILEQSAVPITQPTKTPPPPTENPVEVALPACIPPNPPESAHVTEIIDGDTIHVSMNGEDYTVRYIGIDTPETSDGASAESAKEANARLVLDQDVTMIQDVNNTDPYDRLLRYVMVGNVFVNQQLVVDGLATAKEYPPDTACNKELASAQSTAQVNQSGIWAAAVPLIEQKAATIAIGDASATGNCDPSYPDVCIPPAPPDLDCGDVTFRRFQVVPPDPHHFDMDGDGIGCEGK